MSLFEIFKEHMHSPDEIVEIAVNNVLPGSPDASRIKTDFSSLIDQIQKEAYSVYLNDQKTNGERTIFDHFSVLISDGAESEEVLSTIASSFEKFDKFFLSIAQSRKQRAGKAFEDIIKILFRMLEYPFDEQQVINGKPDFLMPNRTHYDENAMDCIIFTAKRTLRERWRQIVTEGTRGLGFYLATMDKNITDSQLTEMRRNRIYLVMPEAVKGSKEHYTRATNVLSFEEFFAHHLDPAVSRWTSNGVI